jgi:protein-L-isoaspartate(D-aspartate) O-methyltransferase
VTDRAEERERMVDEQLRARGIEDPLVLGAARVIERERFVPAEHLADAYADRAIPIGYGQHLLSPYDTASLLASAALRPEDDVLVVGAGSGYLVTLVAAVVHHVVALERVPQLAARAARALSAIGLDNARILAADGSRGLSQPAPFDVIIVTYASEAPPERLAQQLRQGDGRLVARVGREPDVEAVLVATR